MAEDDRAMREIAYTTLITQVLREEPYPESLNYTLEEYALRFEQDRATGGRYVKLWQRKREYADGLLKKDETDPDLESDWIDESEEAFGTMPFTEGSARKYRYEILDRRQVGNSLVYKIGFEPKSRFDALPAGTVWVDYSNWVIRKVEARMTGAVPFPLILESIPVLRFSQEKVGPYWFMTLRRVPLVPIPDNVEIRVRMKDIEINGEKVDRRNAVPEPIIPPTPGSGLLPEPDGFWLSPEASRDSLDAFWGGIDRDWEGELTPELEPITLTPLQIDSLTTVGEKELVDLRRARWRVRPSLVQVPGYNRVQGFSMFTGVRLDRPGPHRPGLDLRGGYGFANERWLFDARLDLPLVVARGADSGDAGGPTEGSARNRRRLGLTVTGTKQASLFAGDDRRHERSISSFFWGSDPNMYLEHRGVGAELDGRPARGLILRAGGGWYEQRRLEQRTSWNVLGRRLRPDGNLAADALDERRLWGGFTWTRGVLAVDGTATWRRATDAAFLGAGSGRGDGDFLQLEAGGRADLLDGLGNRWVLKGRVRELGRDGEAAGPIQWKTWLGDHGTLRGHQAGELTGDGGAWASLDFHANWDLFRALRVPVLKKWGLQPHLFGDWARTWDDSGPYAVRPGEGARGSRADLGFGFGRNFDLPGLGEFRNLRLHAAHPVGEGSGGKGWRVLLAFER